MANKGKYNPAVQIFAYVSAMRCVSEETVDKVFNILDQDCSNQGIIAWYFVPYSVLKSVIRVTIKYQ